MNVWGIPWEMLVLELISSEYSFFPRTRTMPEGELD